MTADEVPPVTPPSTPAVQTPGFFGAIVQDISFTLSVLPAAQLTTLQSFVFGGIGQILTPIIRQEVQDAVAAAMKAFTKTAEISSPNEKLEADWDKPPVPL